MLHIVIALKNFKLVRIVISVLVGMVNFVMVKVDNFCDYKLISAYFKLFDGKNTNFVVYQIGTINEFFYLNFQRYLFNKEQKDCFYFCKVSINFQFR